MAPELEVILLQVEQGFASSNEDPVEKPEEEW